MQMLTASPINYPGGCKPFNKNETENKNKE